MKYKILAVNNRFVVKEMQTGFNLGVFATRKAARQFRRRLRRG